MLGSIMQSNAFEILNVLMQWIIAPVAASVWFLYREQQKHTTAIAVLQAQSLTAQTAHDKEIKEVRETMRAIMLKLDSIEGALRK